MKVKTYKTYDKYLYTQIDTIQDYTWSFSVEFMYHYITDES